MKNATQQEFFQPENAEHVDLDGRSHPLAESRQVTPAQYMTRTPANYGTASKKSDMNADQEQYLDRKSEVPEFDRDQTTGYNRQQSEI